MRALKFVVALVILVALFVVLLLLLGMYKSPL
jgi:hypothetical protein